MFGLPYEERIEFGRCIPQDGQFSVMSRIDAFCDAEVLNIVTDTPKNVKTVKCAVLNMEHGCRNKELIPFIKTQPDLKDIDILFANELDDGTERSGNINTAEIIAKGMGFNYAYGLEFIELNNPNDEKGFEGNAVFSRFPITRAKALHLPCVYDWYTSEQKRIGARVAVFAEIDLGDRSIGAICVHLENRTDPSGRVEQAEYIVSEAEKWFGDIPVVIGGDCNFNGFDYFNNDEKAAFIEDFNSGKYIVPSDKEKSFAVFNNAGYDYESFNGRFVQTRRAKFLGQPVWLHIDWIFAKRLTCKGHGMASTRTEDCLKWAPQDSPVRAYDGDELSDHNAVWAECGLR